MKIGFLNYNFYLLASWLVFLYPSRSKFSKYLVFIPSSKSLQRGKHMVLATWGQLNVHDPKLCP